MQSRNILASMNQYHILHKGSETSLQTAKTDGLDNLLLYSISISDDQTISLIVQAWDVHNNKPLITEKAETQDYLKIFNLTRDLIHPVAEELYGEHITYGTVEFRTEQQNGWYIELNGTPFSASQKTLELITGTHQIDIYDTQGKHLDRQKIDLFEGDKLILMVVDNVVEADNRNQAAELEELRRQIAEIQAGNETVEEPEELIEADIEPVIVGEKLRRWSWGFEAGTIYNHSELHTYNPDSQTDEYESYNSLQFTFLYFSGDYYFNRFFSLGFYIGPVIYNFHDTEYFFGELFDEEKSTTLLPLGGLSFIFGDKNKFGALSLSIGVPDFSVGLYIRNVYIGYSGSLLGYSSDEFKTYGFRVGYSWCRRKGQDY